MVSRSNIDARRRSCHRGFMPLSDAAYVGLLRFCRMSFRSRESCRSNCSRAIWRPIRRARRSTGSFTARRTSADPTVPAELLSFLSFLSRWAVITLRIPPTIDEFMRELSISDEKTNWGDAQQLATVACKSAGRSTTRSLAG